MSLAGRYKIAGQWYGIPKLFARSETLATEVVQSGDHDIVWKQRQRHTLIGFQVSKMLDSLISLTLQDQGEGEKVVYHEDLWNEKDYSHEGSGAMIKELNG